MQNEYAASLLASGLAGHSIAEAETFSENPAQLRVQSHTVSFLAP
jgi:hypothetical protein